MPFVTRDPTVGLWPVKTGKPGAKPNSWNESAYQAALVAKEKWTRLQSNQTLSCYAAIVAIGDIEEPIFPEDAYDELIGRAFDGRIIETSGHPVIQKLFGQCECRTQTPNRRPSENSRNSAAPIGV